MDVITPAHAITPPLAPVRSHSMNLYVRAVKKDDEQDVVPLVSQLSTGNAKGLEEEHREIISPFPLYS